ncbi:SPOSA6832_05080, partial [Sporobolomyces salmonicolor]
MSSPPPASREPDEQDQGSAAGGTGPWQAVFSPECVPSPPPALPVPPELTFARPYSRLPAIEQTHGTSGVRPSALVPPRDGALNLPSSLPRLADSETGQTTWKNPLESSSTPTVPAPATDSATAAASAASTSEAAPAPAPADPTALPPIDPELAWLDPSAAARTSSTGAQLARFNARTGRFQLQGQGIKRSAEGGDGEGGSATKKRPSSKQIEQFRKSKEEKKRKKLTSWLGS